MSLDPEDLEKIKDKIDKNETDAPCNIWGYIRDLEKRIKKLEDENALKTTSK